jgi:FAD/FMN-containing dehydrogenase
MNDTDPVDQGVTMPVQLFREGDPEYTTATTPANSVARQHPAFVARPTDAGEAAAVIREAAARNLRIVPQATGHGAGAEIGPDTLLVDTSGLDFIQVDADARVARTGAGATWGRVNAAASPHGLLGLAGSAPTVSVAGYTFGGGLGWLARPHGMASAALRRVEYLTGAGQLRIAADDAPDPMDRNAIWAFRGGGGVGLATSLEFDLFPVPDLWAGYLLWEIDALDAVVGAWAETVDAGRSTVSTSISVLHLPPAPLFPEHLRGKPAVHLALASSIGEAAAQALLAAVRNASAPAVDTWGPSDAGRLSGIHLDPPGSVPALGTGRWLTADAPRVAQQALRSATENGTPLVLVELRDVGTATSQTSGAQTDVPAPYLLHAVAPLRPGTRPAIEEAFARLHDEIEPADSGRIAAPWADGAASTPTALPDHDRKRVQATAAEIDPDHRIARSRYTSRPMEDR